MENKREKIETRAKEFLRNLKILKNMKKKRKNEEDTLVYLATESIGYRSPGTIPTLPIM